MEQQNESAIVERFAANPPVDVKGLANALGLTYVERPMADIESGGISYDGLQYVIWVNETESPQRKRFTTAHEIAHYLLHRDILKKKKHMDRLFDSAAYSNPEEPFTRSHEIQANKYAAAILMPKFAIEAEIVSGNKMLSGLARKFDVSNKAMKIRLESLLLTGWHANETDIHMEQSGW